MMTPTPSGLSSSIRVLATWGGDPFLDLQAPGEHVNQAGNLADPHNTLVRDIGHIGPAKKGQDVMLTHRKEIDVFDDNHF